MPMPMEFKITKNALDTWVYRKFDEETEHYIIEDWMCNEFEMDYFATFDELLTWVNVAMDEGTEIIVVSADCVLDCPIDKGYFFY